MSDQSGRPGEPPPPGEPPARAPGPPPAWQAGPPPAPGDGYGAAAAPARTDPLAVTGFVLALVGIVLLGIVLWPIALVLGFISYRRINARPDVYKGKGFAIAALVLGAIGTVLAVISVVVIINDPDAFRVGR